MPIADCFPSGAGHLNVLGLTHGAPLPQHGKTLARVHRRQLKARQ